MDKNLRWDGLNFTPIKKLRKSKSEKLTMSTSKAAVDESDVSPGPGPVEGLLVRLRPDQLVPPTFTHKEHHSNQDELYGFRFERFSLQSFCLASFSRRQWGDEVDAPLERVWGILFPPFGTYLPKADDTDTKIRRSDKAALFILSLAEIVAQKEKKKKN